MTPSRRCLAAAGATVDLGRSAHKPIADRLRRPETVTRLTEMGVPAGLGLAFVLVAWWRLERLRPGRRTRL